jgi:hypothetical protein
MQMQASQAAVQQAQAAQAMQAAQMQQAAQLQALQAQQAQVPDQSQASPPAMSLMSERSPLQAETFSPPSTLGPVASTTPSSEFKIAGKTLKELAPFAIVGAATIGLGVWYFVFYNKSATATKAAVA